MWIIVEFTKDETVAVVPKAWLQDGMCAWDSGRLCQKLIRQLAPPNPEFEKYAANQVGNFETNMYRVAVQKLRRSEETSNLSSCDDEAPSLQPRKKIQNKLHQDFVMGDSSRINEPPILDIDIARVLTETDDILNLDYPAVSALFTNNTFAENNHPNVNDVCHNDENDVGPNDETAGKTHALDENVNGRTAKETPNPTTGECFNCKNLLKEFQTLQVTIEANQKWIANRVEDISKKIQDLFTMMSLNNAVENVTWNFPIESLEDMERFEDDLKTPEFKQKMLKHLSRVGGSSLEDCTRRLWKYLISVETQHKCNWTGIKNKKPLKDSLLNGLIQDAVQQSFGTATLKTIQATTKDYIQHASNRLKK